MTAHAKATKGRAIDCGGGWHDQKIVAKTIRDEPREMA